MKFDNPVKTLIGILIVAVIGVGFIVYAFPPAATPKTLTVTDTQTATILTSNAPSTLTVIKEGTVTQTIALPSTVTTLVSTTITATTTLSTATITLTQVSTQTITQQAPATVTIFGNATSNSPLTKATEIDFSSGSVVYKAQVKGGTYSISLPNAAQYTVTILYNIIPTGASSCTVGTPLPLNTMLLQWKLDWSC